MAKRNQLVKDTTGTNETETVSTELSQTEQSLTLPSFVDALPENYVQTGGKVPYVKIVSEKNGRVFAEYMSKFGSEFKDGCCVLVDEGDEEWLQEPRISLLAYHKYFGNIDSTGELVAVSLNPPVSKDDLCVVPCVDCAVLVHHNGYCVPAMMSFRREVKVQFIDSVVGQLHKVTKDEWYRKSDYHESTRKIPQAYARFTSYVSFYRAVGAKSKQPFTAFNAKHECITREQLQAIYTCMTDDRNRVEAVMNTFNRRKEQVTTQAG
jgi:hypothetical protein